MSAALLSEVNRFLTFLNQHHTPELEMQLHSIDNLVASLQKSGLHDNLVQREKQKAAGSVLLSLLGSVSEVHFPSPQYSLSHAGLWIAGIKLKKPAINGGVGLDIELCNRTINPLVIPRIGWQDQYTNFEPLDYWTIKEALFKATYLPEQPSLGKLQVLSGGYSEQGWYGEACYKQSSGQKSSYRFWGQRLNMTENDVISCTLAISEF